MESNLYSKWLKHINFASLVLISLFSFGTFNTMSAQVTFQKKFSTISFSEMIRTEDGGFACSGWGTKDTIQGSVLLKLDEAGDTVWSRFFLDTTYSLAHSVDQTSDGGFILIGEQYRSNVDNTDILLTRTDSDGNILWVKRLGMFLAETGRDVKETIDSGFIMTGERSRGTNGNYDMFVLKTDKEGNVVWSKSFMGPGDSQGFKILTLEDGGYVVHGVVNIGTTDPDILTIRLNSDGDTLWTRSFGGPDYERSYSIIETAQHQLAIAGLTDSYATGYGDTYLTLLDLNGNWLWSKSYGGLGGDQGTAIAQTRDSGFIIGGNTLGSFDIESGPYIIKTDAFGNTQWSMTYHYADYDDITSLIELESGNFLVTCHSRTFMELSPEGKTGCDEHPAETITMDAPTQFTNQPITIGTTGMYSLPYTLRSASGFVIDEICKTVSTKNPNETSKLKILPNPAQDFVRLELNEGGIGPVKLIDISGNVLRNENALGSSYLEMNISDIPPGMYVLLVESNNSWTAYKLVK